MGGGGDQYVSKNLRGFILHFVFSAIRGFLVSTLEYACDRSYARLFR